MELLEVELLVELEVLLEVEVLDEVEVLVEVDVEVLVEVEVLVVDEVLLLPGLVWLELAAVAWASPGQRPQPRNKANSSAHQPVASLWVERLPGLVRFVVLSMVILLYFGLRHSDAQHFDIPFFTAPLPYGRGSYFLSSHFSRRFHQRSAA